MPALPHRPSTSQSTHHPQTSQGSYRPRPRSHSPTTLHNIRIKNRRKHYLDTHPSYFNNPSHELYDPLTYDRLIRRFQSPAEREAEGRKKGYSGVLEAEILRSEARNSASSTSSRDGGNEIQMTEHAGVGRALEEEMDEDVPRSKEEGEKSWRRLLEERFLRGGDEEFGYQDVDRDGDGEEEGEKWERWFEDEEVEEVRKDGKGRLEGETGVQDF